MTGNLESANSMFHQVQKVSNNSGGQIVLIKVKFLKYDFYFKILISPDLYLL